MSTSEIAVPHTSLRVRNSSQTKIKGKFSFIRFLINSLLFLVSNFDSLKLSIINKGFLEAGIFSDSYCSLKRIFFNFSSDFVSIFFISSPYN